MKKYEIGDIVFYSGVLSTVTHCDENCGIPIYSVHPITFEKDKDEDMLPESALLPVPLTASVLSLFSFDVKVKAEASSHNVYPDNASTEGLSSCTTIWLEQNEKYIIIETSWEEGKEDIIMTSLWKCNTGKGIDREVDAFFPFWDKFAYVHEIQHLIRSMKYDDPFKLNQWKTK